MSGKQSKYHNRKTTIDGHVFASRKEADRYGALKILQSTGHIKNLQIQPRYLLQAGFDHEGRLVREIAYVADFAYTDVQSGKYVIEDVKASSKFKTQVYKLKRKLFLKLLKPDEVFLETY